MEETIEKAIKLLQPIKYEPFAIGYYVLMNDCDMGGEDFCENCIDDAIEKEKTYHKTQRQKIIDKYDKIAKDRFYFDSKKDKVYVSLPKINKARKEKLKEYPLGAVFTYAGHDPNFGGGLSEPCSCGDCGEYFECDFEPDKNEAEHILHILNHPKSLNDKDRWEIELALSHYRHSDDEVKLLLIKAAKRVIKLSETKKL